MKKINALSYGTGTLLLLVGIGATFAGTGFIADPGGSHVGISLELLKDSPFEDYLVPGIVLYTINGLCSLIGSVFAFMKHRWAAPLTILLGMAMLIWITTQVYWIGWQSWLQPTFLGIGLIEIILGYYMNKQNKNYFHRNLPAH